MIYRIGIEVCRLCHGRGEIKKVDAPDWNYIIYANETMPNSKNYPKQHWFRCPICLGTGYEKFLIKEENKK